MKCTDIHALFTDYADNTLDRHSLVILKNHLGECGNCAEEWQAFRQTLQLVQGLEPVKPPADLLPGIHAKLEEKNIFQRMERFLQEINFTMSVPVAVATFSIAMVAGFLVKNTSLENLPQLSPRTPQLAASRTPGKFDTKRTLAVAHTEKRPYADFPLQTEYGAGLHPSPTALATHLAAHQNARRLLSPDLGVLITGVSEINRSSLPEAMSQHAWTVHQMPNGVLLVHLPPGELEHFHAILDQYGYSFFPAEAALPGFGKDKKMLTAAIRFE